MHPSLLLLHPVSLVFWAWLPLPCPGISPAKSGVCPELKHEDLQCGNFCSLNAKCPGNERCCETLCGRQCSPPESDQGGYCPKVDPKPGEVTTCLPTCNTDEDCTEMARGKCCSFGCQRTCMEASGAEHPGVCPLKEEVKTLAPCNDTCSDDRECLFHQKCCFSGCSLSCLDSVRRNKCRLPPERGRCNMKYERYYYDVDKKSCLPFVYGGCPGNSNNFKTLAACNKSCGTVAPARRTSA